MPHSSTATIIASYGQRGILQTPDRQMPYILKGRKLKPVCGDKVEWEPSSQQDEAVVISTHERRNELRRPDSRGKTEILAANLHTIAVVIAAEPTPDFFVADRFLCAAELMGARALLVWNKADLQREEPAELEVYRSIGYPVLSVSAADGSGIDALEESLAEGFAMLVGQSGVGKSSLVNQLLTDAGVATGELSRASREGRHTTTAAYAHELKTGGMLIDSPGIRDFSPVIDDPAQIQLGFIEIVGLADACRFADCTHNREPNCAVKRAVSEGSIDERRYASYIRLRNLSSQLAERLRPA